MHTVCWTPTFLTQANRHGLSEEQMGNIVNTLADDPLAGDVIPATGGARKLRHPGHGGGKSGGYRTIHYFGGADVPVFLLAVYGKGTKANLTKAEKNELASVLPTIADAYRANATLLTGKRRGKK
ncbi:type II toxin-antitoxin system RelE/ParE family toxin [Ruegeria sp.]|uniref:type II toxin-antitoxin system RelE/ParE family toxin n=1 Tax=Ruegeria sp. TaxID=1879320 RepID=UPI003B0017F3